jgi:WD40 repeat protein
VCDEDSGEVHRELEVFEGGYRVTALATFLSADGQQPRVLAGWFNGQLRVYDPEAGSVLHRSDDHTDNIADLACIASPSAASHHPRLVSASWDRATKVWNGETGEMLADLRGHRGPVTCVAVWKEHTGGHDRIATASWDGHARVWDGEAFTLLHDLHCGTSRVNRVLAFKSAEGPTRLLVGLENGPLQVWDPEEGRLLHEGCPLDHCHLFESAQGRHLLAIASSGKQHPRHTGGTRRSFLDVWDLGEAPARTGHVRPANKQG